MTQALRTHWPEYLAEAAELGTFMVAACLVVAFLQYPTALGPRVLPDPGTRRVVTGIAMGLAAIALIYSPWGQRSGAHFNPSVTLTYFRLGKIAPWDAAFYVTAQFAGALAGVLLAGLVLGGVIAHPTVNYVATLPGPGGVWVAFAAEVAISFVLMTVVLVTSNRAALARLTPLFCGALIAAYIALEAPLSGMSMNPARSFGSAVPPGLWSMLWIYLSAPPLGMLVAAEVYLRIAGARRVYCAKLNHRNRQRCIFRCRYGELDAR